MLLDLRLNCKDKYLQYSQLTGNVDCSANSYFLKFQVCFIGTILVLMAKKIQEKNIL